MSKVMVFVDTFGTEWESRAGLITVRTEREIARGYPGWRSGLTHFNLHRMVARGALKFKELRDE